MQIKKTKQSCTNKRCDFDCLHLSQFSYLLIKFFISLGDTTVFTAKNLPFFSFCNLQKGRTLFLLSNFTKTLVVFFYHRRSDNVTPMINFHFFFLFYKTSSS